MTTVWRLLLPVLLLSAAIPAFAVYRCESGSKVTYSDAACIGGQSLDLGNTSAPDNAAQAKQELRQKKTELKQLEHARHQEEARQEKRRRTAVRANAARERKCATLARRKKWADEDAAAAAGKSTEKARRKARRAEETYRDECEGT